MLSFIDACVILTVALFILLGWLAWLDMRK